MAEPDWRRVSSRSSLRAFDAAARTLDVSHAAVAYQVRALEADLGAALLRRAGRGLALTDGGARLARVLAQGFGAIAAGVEALRCSRQRQGLRVTSTPAFAQSILLPRLSDVWRRQH